MSDFHGFYVESGETIRLLTAGKYCDRDIYVSGTGGVAEDLSEEIAEQDELIAEIKAALAGKAAGGGGNSEVPWLTREITEYSNPTLTYLGAYVLSGTNITKLNLPELTEIAGYAFYECTSLAEVSFPKLTAIPYNGFRQFKGLVKADFGSLKSIGANGLYQCTKLETLIIRTNSVCTISTGSVLTGSPILNGTGYVYVPDSLKGQYQSQTNWVAQSVNFRSIEDYPDICG